MKDNILDMAYGMLRERIGDTFKELALDFKGKKPFGKEPISEQEALAEYNLLTPDMMQQRVEQNGYEETNKYVQQMEELKRRMING